MSDIRVTRVKQILCTNQLLCKQCYYIPLNVTRVTRVKQILYTDHLSCRQRYYIPLKCHSRSECQIRKIKNEKNKSHIAKVRMR